ncbi:CylK protein [Streptococcus gallolyticus subsp. gallolyticus]|uniref:CylK protein n=1 Tax=Streptococcus gallolyticus TaxID=315405 RepID=UPI00228439A4|nr:CylK protein [Streptococcus gallolyticus]MCY7172726.1 CylK protein [Streptococcus gallolyticus subsp. gallolyticus]
MQHLSYKTSGNLVILHQNAHQDLDNQLTGARLARYQAATREVTREKLLQGSYFVYRALREIGFAEEICKQAFSMASTYLISLPQGYISYSNSGDYHVLTYSPTGPCGVDLEEYRDRSQTVYDKFLGSEKVLDKKLAFYQKWLEKEIAFKCPIADKIIYESFDEYLLGYFFEDESEISYLTL